VAIGIDLTSYDHRFLIRSRGSLRRLQRFRGSTLQEKIGSTCSSRSRANMHAFVCFAINRAERKASARRYCKAPHARICAQLPNRSQPGALLQRRRGVEAGLGGEEREPADMGHRLEPLLVPPQRGGEVRLFAPPPPPRRLPRLRPRKCPRGMSLVPGLLEHSVLRPTAPPPHRYLEQPSNGLAPQAIVTRLAPHPPYQAGPFLFTEKHPLPREGMLVIITIYGHMCYN